MNEDVDMLLFSGQGNWSFSSPIKELVETLVKLKYDLSEFDDSIPEIFEDVKNLLVNEIDLQSGIQQDAIAAYKSEKAKRSKATLTTIKK